MKYLLYAAIGLLFWAFLLDYPYAAEKIKEMSMKTETGEIVLTSEECTFKKMGLQGYEYAAYATDKGHANHEGCWKMDVVNNMSAVLVYFPEIDATAVYNPKLFSPKPSL